MGWWALLEASRKHIVSEGGRQRWHFSPICLLLRYYQQLKQPPTRLRWVAGYTELPQAISTPKHAGTAA